MRLAPYSDGHSNRLPMRRLGLSACAQRGRCKGATTETLGGCEGDTRSRDRSLPPHNPSPDPLPAGVDTLLAGFQSAENLTSVESLAGGERCKSRTARRPSQGRLPRLNVSLTEESLQRESHLTWQYNVMKFHRRMEDKRYPTRTQRLQAEGAAADTMQ